MFVQKNTFENKKTDYETKFSLMSAYCYSAATIELQFCVNVEF